jgi:serine kinase of HPr protein (carbohydrate metabolism regulator)
MDLQTIIETLNLTLLTEERDFSHVHIDSAYMSDLLSCVMTGAKPHSIWVTLIANINIVAVASLLEISAIVITENAQPNQETIERANMEGIVLLSTDEYSYAVSGHLWELGIKD